MSNPIIFGVDHAKGPSQTVAIIQEVDQLLADVVKVCAIPEAALKTPTEVRYLEELRHAHQYPARLANTVPESERRMTASEVMLRQRCFELSLPHLCNGICVPDRDVQLRKHVNSRVVELKGLPGGKDATSTDV